MKLKEIKELMLNLEYKQMKYQPGREVEILCEGKYKDYQFYILNLGTHPTAYIEISRENILFGKDYNEIDIEVHGGLTYAEDHLQNIKNNTWFIDWDYAHYNDYAGYEIMFPKGLRTGGKKWATEEIFDDVVSVIEQIESMEYKVC